MRPTKAIINLSAITHNYQQIKQAAQGAMVMWILKANAYGHGLVSIAQHLEILGGDYLGVAYLEEGIALREAQVTLPILVLGGIDNEQIEAYLQNGLTITAPSIAKLEAINSVAQRMGIKAKVHLKIDTGMERIGVHYYNAGSLINAAKGCSYIEVEGMFTHLSQADSTDQSYSLLQLKRWEEIIDLLPADHNYLLHVANSGAIAQLPNATYDMVRCGLMLYGIYPAAHLREVINLQPALSLISKIVYFKAVKAHHPVSYGGTWSSDELTRVVTIPIGYGDGYMRSISGHGEVIIHDKRYPIIGSICMDQLMVNIGTDSAYNGDEVILIGGSSHQQITVEEVSNWANTIPWELLTSINDRVPRVYIQS